MVLRSDKVATEADRESVTVPDSLSAAGAYRPRPVPDRIARRLLCIPEGRRAGEGQAYRLFSTSIFLSAARCLLTYVVLPLVSPLVGAITGIGAAVGIPLAVVALIFDVRAVRRFWLAEHKWRWPMTGLYVAVMALVLVLLSRDIARIV
jgi:hypothetical protein